MYIPDLTPYNYGLKGDKPLSDVKGVGWLSREHPFPTGNMDEKLLKKLEWFCIVALVNETRGFHVCEFCELSDERKVFLECGNGFQFLLGTAEVWIPGPQDTLYAAPNFIVHYIRAHQYLPPSEFLEALSWADERETRKRGHEFERRRFVGGDWDWKRPDDPPYL